MIQNKVGIKQRKWLEPVLSVIVVIEQMLMIRIIQGGSKIKFENSGRTT